VSEQWTVLVSKEVAEWYATLTPRDRQVTDRMIGLLQEEGNRLRMPHSRSLGDGLFELRFELARGTVNQRITYAFDVSKHVITLTAFRKTRNNESQQVKRARQQLKQQLDARRAAGTTQRQPPRRHGKR
jgi:hypothetical protein